MHNRLRRGRAVALAVVPLTLAVGPAAHAASPARTPLVKSQSAWTQHTASLGAAATSTPVSVRVYLQPRGGQAAEDAAVHAVSSPTSSSYRQFLTPAQFRARFQPTDAAVAAVNNWLRSAGLTVTTVEGTHRYVAATGDVASAQKAFGTAIANYSHAGQVVQAPSGTPTVPAVLSGYVAAVAGLDTTPQVKKTSQDFPPPGGFRNARPCSLYYGQVTAKFQADFSTPLPKFNGQYVPYAPCGYLPDQFRAVYEGDTNLDGTGRTVAIIDAYAGGTIFQDANQYATQNDHAPFAQGQFTQSLPSSFDLHPNLCQAPADWSGEETLDVEAVHGMAPGANIRYYGAKSCLDDDLIDALNRVVDQNKADIVSNSYGDVEEAEGSAGVVAWEQAFKQAALQGITVMFSSGDNGDEVANTGIRQADYPASDPYITSVGGTATAIGPGGELDWQTGWGTHKYSLSQDGTSWTPLGFLYGSGGGFSSLFNRPGYQAGVVPAGSPAARGVPDIAADADPTTGMRVGQTQVFPDGTYYDEYRIGGTSLASPLVAGETALAAQHAKGRVGFLNPAMYRLQRNTSPSPFKDVLPVHTGDGNVRADFANGVDAKDGIIYSVRTFDQDSSLNVTPGWDDVTGLGTPKPRFLTSLTAASSGG